MNRDLKDKWVKALTSGKYKQGRNLLRDGEDRYCCLGVLCDLVNPTAWTWEEDPKVYSHFQTTEFPSDLIRSVELNEGVAADLTLLNDTHGKTFYEIAEYIQEHV